jgi:hypothetical protein
MFHGALSEIRAEMPRFLAGIVLFPARCSPTGDTLLGESFISLRNRKLATVRPQGMPGPNIRRGPTLHITMRWPAYHLLPGGLCGKFPLRNRTTRQATTMKTSRRLPLAFVPLLLAAAPSSAQNINVAVCKFTDMARAIPGGTGNFERFGVTNTNIKP